MNPRDRLQYALYLQRLQELFVIKENIAFEYQHANYNQAAAQIDKAVDKMLQDNVVNIVDGTTSLEKPNLDHVITEALSKQQNMLIKTPDRYIQNAVEQNTKHYTDILQSRIEKENYSLQRKIEEEYRKKKYNNLSEEEAKKLITEKFQDHGRRRAKNIVKDALHTNQANLSWIHNMENGAKYKVWMNGRSKGKTRPWHVASLIQPCYIDDYFDILYGSAPVQMMYPGDLYGGAENVANCKCWVYYTNVRPKNFRVGKTFSSKSQTNNNTLSNNLKTKIQESIRETFKRIKKIPPFRRKYYYDPDKDEYDIPKNYKKFVGVTEDGKLPENEKISTFFSKDVSKTNLFDKTIYDWTCKPFDKKLRIFSNNDFNIGKLKKSLLNDPRVKNEDIPHLLDEANVIKRRMENLMDGGYLKENMILHRQQTEPHIKNFQVGEIFEWDSYNSTSISKEGVDFYQSKVNFEEKWDFTILAPKNTKGVYISTKSCEKYASEMEFVLDRGTKFEILDINYEHKQVLLKIIV